MADPDRRGLVVRNSRWSHSRTVEQLVTAAATHGATVFAVIDHAANAAAIGLELAPTTVVIFGNPAVGTPLMREEPSVALDLPSRVLIREVDAGTVEVVYLDPAVLAERHGLDADEVAALTGLISIVDGALGEQ